MIVKDIQPREIAILCEYKINEIDSLIFCLDNCVINYDSENENEKEKVDYVVNTFYKTLVELRKRIENVT